MACVTMYVCRQSPFMFFCICYYNFGLLNCCFVFLIQTVFASIKFQLCCLLAYIPYVMTSLFEVKVLHWYSSTCILRWAVLLCIASLHIRKFYADNKDAILLHVQSNTVHDFVPNTVCMCSACVFSDVLSKQPP